MTVAIREATPADLPAICALGQDVNRMHHEAWPRVFAAPSDPNLDAPHWQQAIGNANASTFVGEQAGQVVAFITVFLVVESNPLLQPVPLARVGSVCVAAHLRGRGIGRLLMQRAEQWARERGASYLRLNVWAFNEPALRFYEELGYGVHSRILGKDLSPAAVGRLERQTAGRTQVAALSASDTARYRELMLHAYAAAADAFTSTPEERAAEPESWWVRRIADPSGLSLAFGAFHDDRLVGTATIEFSAKPKTRHRARLIGMFVHESCRGMGAGAELVHAALAAARARSEVRLVTLTVTEGNAQAIALYERCGFRRFGTEPMAIATPEGYKAKVHMWVPLEHPRHSPKDCELTDEGPDVL